MEMTRVPESGYRIIGLWISGLQRRLTLANLLFPFKVISSYIAAIRIIVHFKPDVVVGTGGYASGPLMFAAVSRGIPSLIQEQNSYAGLTNKRLARKATRICVAYRGMEKYFPAEKLVLTGNPVRKDILNLTEKRERGLTTYGFSTTQKTLLILGGSLGARTINESILAGIDKLRDANIQVIWQTGKGYYQRVSEATAGQNLLKFRITPFIKEMDLAYAAADVVVARAGALSISELCLAAKPAILVPSPNVAEDHQTKNAQALVQAQAAMLLPDSEARHRLVNEALTLLFDLPRCARFSTNIQSLARPHAARDIVNEIEIMLSAA